MPNLINLLPADVRLNINSLGLKQFVSFYKSITIDSYDAHYKISVCYICGNNWVIYEYTYACARECEWTCVCARIWMSNTHSHACTCLRAYTCTCMCMNKGVCWTITCYLLLVFFDINICVNVFPYLCVYTYGYVPHLWWCIIVWYLQHEPSWLCNEKRYWLPPWNPLFLYIYIHIYISKLILCTSHHIIYELSQLFLGLLHMVAFTTAVHLKL